MRRSIAACRALVLALLTLALAAGCSEERPPISRVQANALAKSFFVGELANPADDPEFYMHVSVIDVMYGANSDGLITSADGQTMTRIRWEITEKSLVARLRYELIQDSDRKGLKETPDGQIVAAFAIEKHFDIQTDYNPSTGEALNVIVENDADKPWYQREYFRVDWSKNLVTDAYSLDTLSQIGILYAVEWEPLSYYVSDPSHPDAPVFSVDDGYFDITNKVLAKPGVVDTEWGKFPACWFVGAFPEQSCNPTEVKLRTSFLRVKDSDYEPTDWNGERMDLVGVFTQDRFGFEAGYGVIDDKWHRFAARWNLFGKSHASTECATLATTPFKADVHRDDDQDGTEDECAAVGRGSHCDEFRQRCTIPVRDRAVRTLAWFVNPGFPTELYEPTRETLAVWNDAVRVGLLAGRLAECRRTKGTDCEATFGWPNPWADDFVPPVGADAPSSVPNVFVLCHNPVEPGDDPACGSEGHAPRLGDLRYNFITNIVEPQTMSPWGIMVDAEDPLSGEKISGSVNLWGARTDHAAAQLADLLMLTEGLLDPTDYVKGKNVAAWVAELQKGGTAAHAGRPVSKEEVARHYAAFDSKALEPLLANVGSSTNAKENPHLAHKKRLDALANLGRLGPGNSALVERLQRLKGSSVEAQLVSPEMAQLAGFDPTAPTTPETVRQASPFGQRNPWMRRALKRQALLARAKNGSCRLDREDVEPDNLLGLATKAKKLFGTPSKDDAQAIEDWRKKIYEWARVQYTKGVLAHELGHSMGLRHNFAASFDSLNYDPEYWQLRTKNATVTDECPEGTTDGTDCIGPRWRDPISKQELENDIGSYATTSVMDYPGDTSQDQRLLGKYDRAAMRFIYGNVVDVWAAPGVSVEAGGSGEARARKLTAFGSNPGLMGIYYFPTGNSSDPYENLHYSRYQDEFGLLSGCAASDAPNAVLGQRCKEQPLDVVDYRDMQPFADDPDYAQFSWGRVARAVDGAGRVRRGYLFQSDEYADAGNVTTFTEDAGADAYEIVRFLESQYELRYVMDNFRRNRTSFNSDDVVSRVQGRYFEPIASIAKTFAFGALLSGDPKNPAAEMLTDGNFGPLALAASTAFEMFGRQLTRPEPGYYCSSEECYFVNQPYGVDNVVFGVDADALPDVYGYNFNLPLGAGRYVHNDFDYDQGYWWGDYQKQAGSYYDKIWAVYYLSEAFDNFISNSKEDFIDGRYKNVSFATVYPEQVRRLYNALLTGDYDTFAPRVRGLAESELNPPAFPVLYPEWSSPSGPPAMDAKAQLVEPSYGWNERIYAMVWGSMFFPTNWSYDFANQAKLAVLPSEVPDWYDDEIRAFYDPKSGLTYRARSTGTEQLLGHPREKAAGARMVEWANRLLAEAYKVERDGSGKPRLDAFGTPILIWDANGHAQPDETHPGAAAVLQGYVDQMDMFRQLTSNFTQPLGDLPQP
jgi:hypothetical protein